MSEKSFLLPLFVWVEHLSISARSARNIAVPAEALFRAAILAVAVMAFRSVCIGTAAEVQPLKMLVAVTGRFSKNRMTKGRECLPPPHPQPGRRY